ncbi:MAG: replication-associated recombination protein A [Chloroflexi bacterium]|nr:replication-associated recombination protein A [Chloroflexota bacterium]
MFSTQERVEAERHAPLAARMRPRTLDEYLGQDHVVGAGRMLRKAIERDAVPSLVLWGPPGSGKTTLAGLIAAATRAHFEPLSAVTAGVADLRRVVQEAKVRRRDAGRPTILFIDEIHRFNKAQQDVVLPHVEDGTVTLIGATTENPSFEVIAPLLSRCRVVVLRALTEEEIAALLRRALADTERGLGTLGLGIDDDALEILAAGAGGDARGALNTLEVAAQLVESDAGTITSEQVREALQHRSPRYDKAGESHYDTISAFIKSVRASDPDAAVYWLARMVSAGEDPLFIARRIVILASEDIGMADSNGLSVAVAAQQAVHLLGMPEALYPLAHATLYLATAPKSNSAKNAYFAAMQDVERTMNEPVPLHLRNAVTGLMRGLGYGRDYKYAHDFIKDYVPANAEEAAVPPPVKLQENLPDRLHGATYYHPGPFGLEARVQRWLARVRESAVGGQSPDQAR